MGNQTFVIALMTETLPGLFVALATLALTWGVGHRLATYWSIQQKRKALELAAANNFYEQYGEFFAVWKLWNYALEEGISPDQRAKLLKRATTMEAGLEAGLVKVSAERRLSVGERDDLGSLRQGFQLLRESIRDKKRIPWRGSGNAQYVEFKRLATWFGNLLASGSGSSVPTAKEAAAALSEITDNRHEAFWKTNVTPGRRIESDQKKSAA